MTSAVGMAERPAAAESAPRPGARLANIQALRAIAVLLVVAVHMFANEQRASADPILPGGVYHGVSGVDLFFVISGLIMVWITRDQHGRVESAGSFLFARAARIYPPVWLFTSLAIVAFMIEGSLAEWTQEGRILASYLLYPYELPPVLGVSWTIVHELYFYLVFAVLLILPARALPFALALWGALIGIGEWMGWDKANPWTKIILHPLTFEFLAGAFVGLMASRWRPPAPAFVLAAGVVAFIAGAFWLGLRDATDYPQGWGRVIAFGPGAALIVWGAAGLEIGQGRRAPTFLSLVGDWSYSLYLSHLLVIASLAHLWMDFAQPGVADNLAMLAAMLAAPLVVAAISYYTFERPGVKLAHTLRDRIFGKRKASVGHAA